MEYRVSLYEKNPSLFLDGLFSYTLPYLSDSSNLVFCTYANTNHERISIDRNPLSLNERIIFVRIDITILSVMIIKNPLSSNYLLTGIVAFTIITIFMTIYAQTSFAQTRSLDLTIYPDGSTHVFSEYIVDPLEQDFQVKLFGDSVDNFVAINNEFLLSSEIVGNLATIETFGSDSITVYYDTHDLVSKSGRIWTFDINSPFDYTLLMPENSVIIGMSNIPSNMEIIDDQSKLILPSGNIQIDYVFITSPDTTPPQPPSNDHYTILILAGFCLSAVAAVSIIIIKKRHQMSQKDHTDYKKIDTESIPNSITSTESQQQQKTLKEIFDSIPDLREDDKEIITYIHENGGQILESELRKKFLKPRTTMWRTVKRLERYGVIEVEKKYLQNLIKIKNKMEGDTT